MRVQNVGHSISLTSFDTSGVVSTMSSGGYDDGGGGSLLPLVELLVVRDAHVDVPPVRVLVPPELPVAAEDVQVVPVESDEPPTNDERVCRRE